ncbi:MAG: caspase family protein [Proteobacteria bacterium]|nr:caspase family protein [Pseudomonadota bacterium]MBU1595707.1 caspase family protein [Pseudomonadota bacterium]
MRHFAAPARLILALAALVLLTSPALADGGRYALVIGNSAYKDKPLKNPANDAKDMGRVLQRLGFDVQLKTDVGLRDMEEAIREFGVRLKRGGVGLFYFAGHGVQVQGVNYLVPIGARISSESDAKFESVDAGRVLGKMEDAGNELNIVILDACRNNPFARSFRSADQGLARMDAPTGSIVAYATAPNSVASDGKGANGMYTKYLLENMTTPGIPIEEVFKRVRIGVMGESAKKQVPWESSSIAGYFFLAGPPQSASPVRTQQSTLEQRQQEQKLKEYIAGLEAERRQVEQERADLERRRQQLDQEAAKKLAEAQAPQEKRLKEQLAVLEAERRKLEQERLALELARRETERQQAAQAVQAKQQAKQGPTAKAGASGVAVPGPLASVDVPKPLPQPPPQRPRVDDRATVLGRLAGVWRLETDGNWNFPMLQLKPGGDTLYGTLLGEERLLSRVELTGLAVEDGSLHVRMDIARPAQQQPRARLRDFLGGRQQGPVRTIECVGNLRGLEAGDIALVCERLDGGARKKETGRMVRSGGSRGF